MALSKKHFERMAVIVSDIDSDVEFERTLTNMIYWAQDENARFCTLLFEKRARTMRANRMGS